MLVAMYRLASHLHRTVGEISGIPSSELHHWLAYLKLYPPDEGDTKRTAALMATITNMAGRSLPDKKHVKAEDFLGSEKPAGQSWQDQKAFLMSMTRH